MPTPSSPTTDTQPRILTHLSDSVGNTPLLKLNRVVPQALTDAGTEILLKMESENPLKSVKDRIGRAMIDDAERSGTINKDTHIIEPTSGNTGIALAFICAERGYKLTLTMPESMSLERRALLKQLGAKLVLTPKETGIPGAIERANQLLEEEAAAGNSAWTPSQFTNPANPAIHEQTTGPEIWRDSSQSIDAIVAGVGTGGTITGVTRFIRPHNADFKAIAVEPADSTIISGGSHAPHKIQGIGAGFIPDNLDTSLLNGTVQVTNEEAFEMAARLARQEGVLAGISAGANVAGAIKAATEHHLTGKRLVTICCSFGERYLSTPLFDQQSS